MLFLKFLKYDIRGIIFCCFAWPFEEKMEKFFSQIEREFWIMLSEEMRRRGFQSLLIYNFWPTNTLTQTFPISQIWNTFYRPYTPLTSLKRKLSFSCFFFFCGINFFHCISCNSKMDAWDLFLNRVESRLLKLFIIDVIPSSW